MKIENAKNQQLIELLHENSSYQTRSYRPLDKLKFTKALKDELHRNCRYQVGQQNEEVLMTLIDYFCRLERFHDNEIVGILKPSLAKGIYLYGHPGSGKTDILNAIRKVIMKTDFSENYPEDLRFMKYHWDKIASDVKSHGSTVIKQYGSSLVNGIDRRRPMNYWFDEFAPREGLKDYGTPVDLYDIFKLRYELFRDRNVITHITTNIFPEDLPKFLPKKIVSRFYEMFNFIPLGADENYIDFRIAS